MLSQVEQVLLDLGGAANFFSLYAAVVFLGRHQTSLVRTFTIFLKLGLHHGTVDQMVEILIDDHTSLVHGVLASNFPRGTLTVQLAANAYLVM